MNPISVVCAQGHDFEQVRDYVRPAVYCRRCGESRELRILLREVAA